MRCIVIHREDRAKYLRKFGYATPYSRSTPLWMVVTGQRKSVMRQCSFVNW